MMALVLTLPTPCWIELLSAAPTVIDSSTPWDSDHLGYCQGFYDSNARLTLANHGVHASVAGNALPSLPSWMRLSPGGRFGGVMAGLVSPHLNAALGTWVRALQLLSAQDRP